METITLDVGDKPRVKILSVGGDLRLSGRESTQLEAKVPRGEKLSAEQKGDWLEIKSISDCLIFLPREAVIEGETIGGDMRVINIVGDLLIRSVGGDLSLRGIGQASIETVGGDLHARKATGDLSVDGLGGDGIVDRISGDVRLRSVGGDLSLKRVDGLVEVNVGGDTSVLLTTLTGERVKVNTGGDLSCRLPEDASARVMLSAGGEINYPRNLETERSDGSVLLKMGEGEVELQLSAGGDIWFQSGAIAEEAGYSDLGATISSQIESEIESGIAEMEARLEAMGAGLGTFDSDRVGEHVRRAFSRARRGAERARRKAEYARSKAERKAAKVRGRVNIDFGSGGRPRQEVSDEERLIVLRMLEKGSITVEEAEKLLQSMEGGE